MKTARIHCVAALTMFSDAVPACGLRGIVARLRYEFARADANVTSWRFQAELPRVEIAAGRPGRGPQYAYSEDEIEVTWGQFRHWSPGSRRDALERGYHERLAEFRAKKAAHDHEYETCGYAAADRELAVASRYLDSLELFA